MISLSFEKCRQAVDGHWITAPVPEGFEGVSTDTRTIQENELFVALEGSQTDGHRFVLDAAEQGAAGALVEQNFPEEQLPEEFCVIRVDDTIEGMLDLASFYRERIQTTVVAITGSNGKTTTKDMTHHLVSKNLDAQKAPKSYNNFIGVPLTLFRTDPTDDVVVMELGCNEPGEIEKLAKVIQPDIAILTSISPTHLEGLENIQGVKREKERILFHLRGGGKAIYNRDNEHVADIVESKELPSTSYGFYKETDVQGKNISSGLNGIGFEIKGRSERIELPILGSWNVYNALAATIVARTLDYSYESINDRFSSFHLPSMRMERKELGDIQLINDAYNANPRSVQLVLDELDHYDFSGRKILVLGDMAELGAKSDDLHRQVGDAVASSRTIDQVHFVGSQMQKAAKTCRNHHPEKLQIIDHRHTEEAASHLQNTIRPGDLILLKASRVMELETIEEQLSNPQELPQFQKN